MLGPIDLPLAQVAHQQPGAAEHTYKGKLMSMAGELNLNHHQQGPCEQDKTTALRT